MNDEGEFEVFQRLSLARRVRLISALAGDPLAGPRVRLSAEQQRMLLLEQTDPTGRGHTLTSAWWIEGPLDVGRFRTAVETVLNREWSLRQRYVAVDGATYQLSSSAPIRLETTVEGPAAPGAAMDPGLLDELSGGPLDPMREPLVRARLRGCLFTLCVHHAAADGAALSMLLGRIAGAYRDGPDAAEPAGTADGFTRHLVEQARYLASEQCEEDTAYWRGQLAGLPPPVSFPPVLDGDAGVTTYHRAAFTLTAAQYDALSTFAASRRATLVQAVLAAYHVMLARYSGSGDITIGLPTDVRHGRHLRDVVGNFVNTLAVRVRAPASTFDRHLSGVRDALNEALLYQRLPFDRVTAAAGRAGRPGRGGQVCSAFLSVEPYSTSTLTLPGLSCRDVEPYGLTAPWGDVSFFLQPSPAGGATDEFVVASDTLDAATTRAAAEHLRDLLRAAPSGAGEPLSRLAVHPGASTVTGTVTPLGEGPATRYLAAAAERTPGAVAVRDHDGDLSYADLWSTVRTVARGLVAAGVRPGDRVGVTATRDRWSVVGLYAVLRAGGVYLPIGAALPHRRLEEMAEDSAATLVLRTGAPAAALPGVPELTVEQALAAGRDTTTRLPGVAAADPAYLLFTSGSTGRPKGVLNSHRSLGAFVDWCLGAYDEHELAHVLGSTPATFDISLFELFAPLAAGGELVLLDDLFALRDHPGADDLTLINTVPSLMKEYLADWDLPANVVTVNFCGEVLPNALAQEVYRRGPAVTRVDNLYGPSEDTVFSTVWPVPRGWRGALPIGRPLDNSGATVRGPAGEPLPTGAPGELVLFGACLADGYPGHPAETAGRFVPYEGGHGARAYRTGDVARLRPDGNLEFLGRADRQIKLRGLRIEPGEIEAAVMTLDGIGGCAVVAVEVAGEPALAAYVTVAGPASADLSSRVRAHLAERLPGWMVPAHVVTVAAIPLTPSGKLDAAALPAPAVPAPRPARRPGSVLEEVIRGLFGEVLGRSGVEGEDDFFGLGGTSLKAMRLASRLRDITGRDVTAATMFTARTPASLARALGRIATSAVGDLVLVRSGDGPALVCLPPGGGNNLVYSALAAELSWPGPVYAVTAPGLADDRPLVTSVGDAARQAWSVVRDAGVDDVRALVGFCFGGTVAADMVRVMADDGAPAPDLVAISADRTGHRTAPSEIDLIDEYGYALAEAAGLAGHPTAATHPTLDDLVRWAGQVGITGPGMSERDLVRGYRVWANNLRVLAAHDAGPARLPVRGLFVRAAREPYDPSGQWAGVFTGGLRHEAVPSDHARSMRLPHVRHIAAVVDDFLGGTS